MAYTEATAIVPIEQRSTDDIARIHDPWPAVTPSAPYTLINEKFDRTMEVAEEYLIKLNGVDGNSGYLGTLNSLITSYALPTDLPTLTIDIDITTPTAGVSPPTANLTGVDITFDSFDVTAPVPIVLPTIDTSSLALITPPDSGITTTINWTEIPLSSTLYDLLVARIIADITTGATGLAPGILEDEFAQTLARQAIEDDKAQLEIEEYFSSRGCELPTGMFAARLAEHLNERQRKTADVNVSLTRINADLAQKNSQFIIERASAIEKMLRDSRDAESNRKLDKEKSQVQFILQKFAEQVRAYIGEMEATKIYIEAQVSALQGAVEYNKGLVQVYAAQADVHETLINAQAKANDAIVSVYDAEIRGYEAESKALNADKMVVVENNKAIIAKAEVELRAIIAKIDNSIEGYKTEAMLKERVTNDMATITTQIVASMASSTNVNASMGYTGSESRTEGYDHNESISQSVHFSQSISEDHSYPHEPAAV